MQNHDKKNKEFLRLIRKNESSKHIAHTNRVFLQNIVEALPQYVFWKDLNSIYQGCNKNYANLVGLNFSCEVKFSMKELVNRIYMLFLPSVEAKKLELTVQYDENIPNFVLGDQTRIHRILLNLVSNAVKFTQIGKIEIRLSLAKQEGKNIILKMMVEDTGIGISADQQEVIFSKFTRLESAYKSTHKGSGLGLSIVKQFIADIEGEIYVESQAGVGSTFVCVFPLKKALLDESKSNNMTNVNTQSFTLLKPTTDLNVQSENEVDQITEDQLVYQRKTKLLLVEDNKIAQMGAKNLLKEEINCEVTTADTGEIALELCRENKYDLIFMDVGLPGKDGCETTQAIRALEKQKGYHTPIIALTAHVDESNKQQCLQAGMEEVLTKPLKKETATKILSVFVYPYFPSENKDSKSNILRDESLPIIDLVLGAKVILGDEEAAKEMLDLFVKSLTEEETNIKLAYESKDWDKLQFAIHKLHGGTCYCGVPRLKAVAKKLEILLKHKDIKPLERNYIDLLAEMSAVRREYEKFQSLNKESTE